MSRVAGAQAVLHPDGPDNNPVRLRVEILGAVQGVGFRPFVFRLATSLQLTGWVVNDTQGVFIEVEGLCSSIDQFLERLPAEAPPLAIIQQISSTRLPPAGYLTFEIRHSDSRGAKTVLVLPDAAACPECLAEVTDPSNRRYRYPFTNCTNCGPRFSIIQALPYDRPNTTMSRFAMCPVCQREYDDPLDRRFHAQPNACPDCGPQIAFYAKLRSSDEEPDGQAGASPFGTAPAAIGDAALTAAVAALQRGQIVAVKGLGGFHLMVDARDSVAVSRLRARKPRRDKPFAVMLPNLATAHRLCVVLPEAEPILVSSESPIVLLRRSDPSASPEADQPLQTEPSGGEIISHAVAPGNPYLGVMLPYTPMHHLLLSALDFPVVATSGNVTDEPICIDEVEAMARLGSIADCFLVHNRPIERHVDDSVVWITRGTPRILRRARGHAPLPVLLEREMPPILAVGAHLKSTVALSVGKQVFVSQHIGDLETSEAMAAFERVIADFLRLYEASPIAIAHDMHPDYLSTQWALRQILEAQDPMGGIVGIAVQHHHAHLAACLAENGVDGPALGVVWDGTGYGVDGTIWGGEFLLGDAGGYSRVAHLRPFRLPGGDAAVFEPRRVALALLWEVYGEGALEMDLPAAAAFPLAERRLLGQMLGRGINAPVTTSMGRLFDGVSALTGLRHSVTFEGQAAMALEFAADPAEESVYPIDLVDEAPMRWMLDWRPLVEAIVTDVRREIPVSIMAARFHNGLIRAIAGISEAVGYRRVALTGGCFQNRLLVERATDYLESGGFDVLLHRRVPPNDGGISLGQVAVAAARLASSKSQATEKV